MTEKTEARVKTAAEINAANDYSTAPVPLNKRKSTVNVSFVLIAFCISMVGLYTGATLTGGLSVTDAIITAIVGNVILVVYAGLTGMIGAKTGLGTYVLLRRSFGRAGSAIVSVIFTFTLVGWYAYQCGFFGDTIYAMFPNAGFITMPVVAGIWGGALMMLTAYFGFKGLGILSMVAAPLILLISLIGIIIAVGNAGGWEAVSKVTTEGDLTVSAGIVMVVGAFAVGGVIQSDITRYSKGPGKSMVATMIGYLFAHSFVIIAGYMLCTLSGFPDMAMALLAVIGIPSLMVLILAQWTTNDNNLYSSSLALNSIFSKVKKKHIVLIMGIAGTIIGAFGIGYMLAGWLTFLGTAIPPVGGILIADFYIVRKRNYPFGKQARYGLLSIPAIVSWIVAAICGFAITWGIACINSLVIGLVLYIVLEAIFEKAKIKKYIGPMYKETETGDPVRVTDEDGSGYKTEAAGVNPEAE
ncbi:MAG: cytosine permease [Christensenella sp.]|nr:cytosine permease [Christensenella sp.]